MNTELQLIQDTRPIADIVASAKYNIKEGYIAALDALAILTTYEKAIAQIKDDPEIKELCFKELGKYGKNGATIGEFTFTEAEAGVKYDYSGCGCSEYEDMLKTKAAIEADIKQLEKCLKAMPECGMADTNSGEIWYPPVKTSKTIIKTTTKK